MNHKSCVRNGAAIKKNAPKHPEAVLATLCATRSDGGRRLPNAAAARVQHFSCGQERLYFSHMAFWTATGIAKIKKLLLIGY